MFQLYICYLVCIFQSFLTDKFLGNTLATWFRNLRTVYGKLKRKKSGQASKPLTALSSWTLTAFAFLDQYMMARTDRQQLGLPSSQAGEDGEEEEQQQEEEEEDNVRVTFSQNQDAHMPGPSSGTGTTIQHLTDKSRKYELVVEMKQIIK